MAYTKTEWTNTTPINTNNLNKIEQGIEDVHTKMATKNIMIATRTTNYEISNSPASTDRRVPVTSVHFFKGDKLTLEDYGIKIGAGVTTVRANGSVTAKGIANNMRMGIRIIRGDTSTKLTECQIRSGAEGYVYSFELSPIFIDVQENDRIELYFYSGTEGTVTYYGQGQAKLLTYLTVEVIE